MSTPKKILIIASIAHGLNNALLTAIGDENVVAFADAPEAIQKSCIAGVEYHLENPDVTPEQGHEAWLKYRAEQGWTLGPKDVDAKTHPNMVPYGELPLIERAKDHVFRTVVHALKDLPLEAVVAAAPAIASAGLAAPVPRGLVPVTYVGKRETYKEALYGSGLTFTRGQTLPVPAAIATKMLAHPDVYALGSFQSPPPELSEQEAKDAAAKEAQGEKDKEEDRQQDHRDAIARMDSKASVADFIKVHFNVDVDKRKSLDALKAEAVQLVDRFGVA